MQNLMHSLLYLLSHFECDSHTVHMLTQWHLSPPLIVQWSHHCSRMCIPVHFPWLPGYIDVAQTIHVILTMAGLFPDRPCIYTHIQSKLLFDGIMWGSNRIFSKFLSSYSLSEIADTYIPGCLLTCLDLLPSRTIQHPFPWTSAI